MVFLDATGRGVLGLTFLPSFGSERMGTRSGSQYSQFPGLWSRSSVSFQAQISYPAPHSLIQSLIWSPRKEGHMALPIPSFWACSVIQVVCVVLPSYCLWLCSARKAERMVLLSYSLWASAAEITLRASQLLLESSLQNSCLLFLTRARVFTQPHFPTSPETIQVRV